jgi:hypothetical protein
MAHERLAETITLEIRGTDIPVTVSTDDFDRHQSISIAGDVSEDGPEEPGEPDLDEETELE